MLTRLQFDKACGDFIVKYSDCVVDSPVTDALKGWSWNEHASMSGFGFMSRTALYTWRSESLPDGELYLDEMIEEIHSTDEATAQTLSTACERLVSQQYVAYSATFQAPAFYFTLFDSKGTPLTLSNLLRTTFFHPFAFDNTEATTFGLTRPASSFPLLSQGDHPTLGTPCWYLHPCESTNSVEDVISEVQQKGWTDQVRLVRWMEAWFMVVGAAVNFKPWGSVSARGVDL